MSNGNDPFDPRRLISDGLKNISAAAHDPLPELDINPVHIQALSDIVYSLALIHTGSGELAVGLGQFASVEAALDYHNRHLYRKYVSFSIWSPLAPFKPLTEYEEKVARGEYGSGATQSPGVYLSVRYLSNVKVLPTNVNLLDPQGRG